MYNKVTELYNVRENPESYMAQTTYIQWMDECPLKQNPLSVVLYNVLIYYMYCGWLNFCGVPIFIRPSSDGTYYGMVMSVRVSVRPSIRPSGLRLSGLRPPVFRTFLLHALTY